MMHSIETPRSRCLRLLIVGTAAAMLAGCSSQQSTDEPPAATSTEQSLDRARPGARPAPPEAEAPAPETATTEAAETEETTATDEATTDTEAAATEAVPEEAPAAATEGAALTPQQLAEQATYAAQVYAPEATADLRTMEEPANLALGPIDRMLSDSRPIPPEAVLPLQGRLQFMMNSLQAQNQVIGDGGQARFEERLEVLYAKIEAASKAPVADRRGQLELVRQEILALDREVKAGQFK